MGLSVGGACLDALHVGCEQKRGNMQTTLRSEALRPFRPQSDDREETGIPRRWRRTPRIATRMFAVLSTMRQLHELLLYLSEALKLPAAQPLYSELNS